jgi:Tfp pilus assembly protein PilN
MPEELTNLLPYQRQLKLLREYRLRLGVVAVSLLSVLVLTAALLLIPTYVLLAGSASAKGSHLDRIKASLSASDSEALSARLDALAADARELIALSGKTSVSKIVSSVLGVPRPGITLSGFAYAPAEGKIAETFSISGVAATRDALRRYQTTLQTEPFARSAELPVSAYAKDADIAFTITVTLAP